MPYGNRPKDKRDFRDAVEEILNDVDIPTRSIGSDHIRTKAVKPTNCDLSGHWHFTGSVKLPANGLMDQLINPMKVQTARVFDHYCLNEAPIVIANASKKNISLVLPNSVEYKDYMYIVKRSDSNTQFSCDLTVVRGDTIDDVTSICIPARGSIICVSSGCGWHILSNYS
mgnify:CR=1 FL=1